MAQVFNRIKEMISDAVLKKNTVDQLIGFLTAEVNWLEMNKDIMKERIHSKYLIDRHTKILEE